MNTLIFKKQWKLLFKKIDSEILHEPIKKDDDFIINNNPENKGKGFVISVKHIQKKLPNNIVFKKKKIKNNFKKRFKLQGTGPKMGKQQKLTGGWNLSAPMRD